MTFDPTNATYAGQPGPWQAPPPVEPPGRKHTFRTLVLTSVAVFLLVVVIAAVASGGSKKNTVSNTPAAIATTATTTVPPAAPAAAVKPAVKPTATKAPTTPKATKPPKPVHKRDLRAGLGDSITLTDDNGDKFIVTLVKVDAHPRSTDGFDEPDAGNRYYAAQFRIKATTGTYSDSPTNGAHAVDSQGQSYDSTFVDSISSGHMFGGSLTISKGGTGLGWIVFEVEKSAKITKVQFGLDSGFSDTGEWLAHKVNHS